MKTQMRWLASPAIQKVLGSSTMSFSQMREKSTSIFLILPPDQMTNYNKLQRMFINHAFVAVKTGGRSPTPCLFMIDETKSLGYMKEIEEGYGFLAGYNIVIWTFWQDKGQLDQLYDKSASTFISSSRAVQIFGGIDEITTNFVKEKLGKRFVKESINPLSNAPITQYLRESNEVEKEICAEVRQLYILRTGAQPMLLRRVDYFKSREWNKLALPDPDYVTSATPPKPLFPTVGGFFIGLLKIIPLLAFWGFVHKFGFYIVFITILKIIGGIIGIAVAGFILLQLYYLIKEKM